MDEQLETRVDYLAEELERGVIVLDTDRKVLAFRLYRDDADAFAKQTVLQRRLPGIAILSGTAILEPCAEGPRSAGIRIHLEHQGDAVGDLWILEDGNSTANSASLHRSAEHGAHEIAKLLFRQHVVRGFREAFRNELASDLLSGSERVRERALNDLVENDITSPDTAVTVVTLAYSIDNYVDTQRALSEVMGRIRRSTLPTNPFIVPRVDHSSFLVLTPTMESATKESGRLARHLAAVTESSDCGNIHLSIGSTRASLLEAYASYEESLLARGVRPESGPIVSWSQLGALQTLLLVPKRQRRSSDMCRRLADLGGDMDHLFLTLRTFLDNAGNVQKTAQDLFIHRTTLYHRLRSIEKFLDIDLDDGRSRLEAHIGIKLMELL